MDSKHTSTPYPAHVVTQKFGPDASMLHGLLPVVRIAPQIDVVVVSLGATPKETGLMADQIAREHNAHDDLVAALKQCRDEMAGLPHSLGYAFTHLPKIDAALAKAGEA